MNMNLMLIIMLVQALLSSSCNDKRRHVFSSDRKNRPITECLEMGTEGFFGAAVAMNCQKSVVDNIFLCSHARTLSYYPDKSSCEKALNEMRTTFGVYSLATDPDA
jgi:hypothetical protein